jgi:hypothetical protein
LLTVPNGFVIERIGSVSFYGVAVFHQFCEGVSHLEQSQIASNRSTASTGDVALLTR